MLLRGSITQAINGVLTFYLLFYFLRDRQRALSLLAEISPLSDSETIEVARRFTDTVYATVYGTVVVAGIQGALSGLMFWWLGLPSPVLWGLVMGLLAIVPVLGAFVVWVPAAILLALNGAWVKAAILTVWGGGLVATIDNLLYPVLVGNRLRLHTVPTFIGVVGGVFVFGVPGLVLGPAAISLTMVLLQILRRRFNVEPPRAAIEPGPEAAIGADPGETIGSEPAETSEPDPDETTGASPGETVEPDPRDMHR